MTDELLRVILAAHADDALLTSLRGRTDLTLAQLAEVLSHERAS